jgi:hypothetical protein
VDALAMVEGWIQEKEKAMVESGMTEKAIQEEIERILNS